MKYLDIDHKDPDNLKLGHDNSLIFSFRFLEINENQQSLGSEEV